MSTSISQIINFFFPPQCLHCRQEGVWLCAETNSILKKIPVIRDPLHIPGVDRVLCRGDYDHPLLSTIVQRLKYDYWTGLTDIFPVLLEPLATIDKYSSITTGIVPIPLHWRRRLQRGFNQSDYLTASLAQLTGYPVLKAIRRQRRTMPQAKLSGHARTTNVVGAFRLRPRPVLPPRIILIDDVITTGSTIQECAAVLRAAGVQEIMAFSLAKG